jgi:hypothetical protein
MQYVCGGVQWYAVIGALEGLCKHRLFCSKSSPTFSSGKTWLITDMIDFNSMLNKILYELFFVCYNLFASSLIV